MAHESWGPSLSYPHNTDTIPFACESPTWLSEFKPQYNQKKKSNASYLLKIGGMTPGNTG
jgi:hypothetical protein